MPVSVAVDVASHLAKRTYSGVVTSEDLLGSIRKYIDIPGFEPSFNELMDFREVESVAAPVEDIRRCAHMPVPFNNSSVRVILAPKEIIYGLARMYQILGEDAHPNIQVVRTVEDANQLLGR
jgi:hypothetical protein